MSNDRTDRAQLSALRAALAEKERELSEVRRRLEEFERAVAEVRHDINTPLAVVMGQAQFLTTRVGGLPEDVARRLRVIEEMCQRISDKLTLLRTLKGPPAK